MEAWMAFVSIIAIVAIVVVAGGLIAFIGHVIIGAFDKDNIELKNKKEVLNYAQYKQLQDVKTEVKTNELNETNEYDFAEINKAKVEEEKKLAEKDPELSFEVDEDEDLESIEKRLKEENEKNADDEVEETEIVEGTETSDDDVDDLDDLLAEISSDVIEEEKEAKVEEAPKMSDELSTYSIDKILEESNSEEAEDVLEEIEDEEVLPEIAEETEDEDDLIEIEEIEESEEESEEIKEDILEDEELEEEVVEEIVAPIEDKTAELNSANAQIEALKAQLEALNKQLESVQAAKPVEIVTINMTEEECLNRIEVLEERLKNVKKDYKINLKEYKPLKKVMTDLERYQTKLRRKETLVAKKKVSLYGVNNYVDIDKEKAEKLANELELYEGLRLSVAHCEEVINANKDRFPILEHTNQILEDQIAHIEADLASAQATLQKIREQNGGSNEGEKPADSDNE